VAAADDQRRDGDLPQRELVELLDGEVVAESDITP
jgi:hypothetical protein